MSFNRSFHLIGALKSAVVALPFLWRQAWLVLLILFLVVLLSQWTGLGLWPRRGLILAALGLQLMAAGALYRAALFGPRYAPSEGLGPGGVQWGSPETRLLAAGLLVTLFWLMVFVTLCVVLALFLGAAGIPETQMASARALWLGLVSGPQPQGGVVLAAMAAVMLTLGVLAVKLSLYQAATIAEHQMVSLNALGLSSGQTVKLFVGQAVLVLPFVLISALVPRLGATGDLDAAVVINLALGIGVLLPVSIAFLAAAYRQIVELRVKG